MNKRSIEYTYKVVIYQAHYSLAYEDCLLTGEWLSLQCMLHSYLAILGTQKMVSDNWSEISWKQIIKCTHNTVTQFKYTDSKGLVFWDWYKNKKISSWTATCKAGLQVHTGNGG